MSTNLLERLGNPVRVMAPMVGQSELPFRMMCKQYGIQLCYTPMFWSDRFVADPEYRREVFQTCDGDRPLIVQFCGNDADTLLQAGLLVQDYCDAIDLNLGCPQPMAHESNVGAFLCSDWNRVRRIVETISRGLRVPVTCKIRKLKTTERTVAFARMLEEAGAQLIALHARTIQQIRCGRADWETIRQVKLAVRIPVIANGDIHNEDDLQRCRAATGADAFMTAEALLENPALFHSTGISRTQLAREYIRFAERYGNAPLKCVRQHVANMLMFALAPHRRPHLPHVPGHADLWDRLCAVECVEQIVSVVDELEQRLRDNVLPPPRRVLGGGSETTVASVSAAAAASATDEAPPGTDAVHSDDVLDLAGILFDATAA